MFKRWIAIALALVAGLLQPVQVSAQPRCSLEHYSTMNGLSDNRIMCIMKDREGFMWMGSWTGINRFDGHNFITYKSHPGDRSELNNNRIDVIVEGNGGMLWLKAYDNQVYRFDKRTEQFLSVSNLIYPGKQSPVSICKIILLQHDHIALLTKDKGFFLVSNTASAKPAVQYYARQAAAAYQLPADSITGFHQDNRGRIWIASRHGLTCLQWQSNGHYQKAPVPAPLDHAAITCMAESTAYLWLGTCNGQLFRLHATTGALQNIQAGAGKINSVYVSRQANKLYLTANSTVCTVQPDSLTIVSTNKYANGELLSLYEDRSGQLWIEPVEKGVVLFKPATKTFQLFTQPNFSRYLHDADEYHVFEDNNGMVWINMKGCGFGYYDPHNEAVKYFYNEAGAADRRFSNMISAQLYDEAGILWLSSDEGGLEKIIFQPQDFTYTKVEPHTFLKAENDVRGMYVDRRNRLWMGTKGRKLYVYRDGKTIDHLFVNPPAFKGGVYSFLEDSKGNIWIGTKADGLYKAEPVSDKHDQYFIKHYMHDAGDLNSLSHNQVYSIIEDKSGRIWVGTFGGGVNLIEEKNGTLQFHHAQNSFTQYPVNACKRVRHLSMDAGGQIWIGTTEGLLVFDPAHAQLYNAPFARYGKIPGKMESLGDNDVQYIYRDHRNTMWVCTSSGGLNKAIGNDPMRSLVFRNYSMKEGLSSDYLLSCVEDKQGNLWIATQNALSRFDIQDEKFRNFNAADGLPQADFAEASCAAFQNGELVFGAMNGYIRFNPAGIVNQKVSANMAFINLQVNSRDVEPGGKTMQYSINHANNIRLQYDQNIISIDYSVLDYLFNGKESYAYRLTGFDTGWHDNKSARRATYTNLPPGEYTFEVRSTSEDLYTNLPKKTLNITILPPPWKTWWAYLIYMVAGIALLWIIRKNALTMLRLRQRIIIERKVADFRLNFFTNISHELRTPLTLILNPLDEIAKTESLTDKGARHLNLVRKNARRLNRFINQLLDLRKAQTGHATLKVSEVELLSFTRRIAGYFSEVAEQKNILLSIESAVEPLYCWMDAEKMDIVIYNVLANAFKFTPNDKSIRIAIDQAPNGHIFLTIADEGPGVPAAELDHIFNLYFEGQHSEGGHVKGTGIGLALSKEFVHLNHGAIMARNRQPQGLEVSIELLPGKEHFEKEEVIFTESLPNMINTVDEVDVVETPQSIDTHTLDTEHLPLLLLVEDNTDLRSFLKDQLSSLYRVETAANGEEGLQKAIALLPDVIISDVMMPVMNGIAMLDRLKNDPSTSHIPVVLLSARYSVESRIEGLQYGADHYLAKPFNNDLLVAALNNLVAQRKRLFNRLLEHKPSVDINPPPITLTSHDEQFLQKVIAIVEERMADHQFNIDAVAEAMNMSRSPFYKKLKSLSGFSPVEFVREIRLKRSLQYLDAGERNIATIAYEVGFNSAKYFSTCFKQRFGQTPSDYLKSNEKPA